MVETHVSLSFEHVELLTLQTQTLLFSLAIERGKSSTCGQGQPKQNILCCFIDIDSLFENI